MKNFDLTCFSMLQNFGGMLSERSRAEIVSCPSRPESRFKDYLDTTHPTPCGKSLYEPTTKSTDFSFFSLFSGTAKDEGNAQSQIEARYPISAAGQPNPPHALRIWKLPCQGWGAYPEETK